MDTNPSIRSIAGYAELPLDTLDAEKIEAVWCYTPLVEGRQLVLPDGRMDLVVHCAVMPQGIAKPVLLVIAGPTQTPTVVALRPQTVILGVRFHIGWGGACLGIAPSAVRNRTVVGSEVERCLGFLAREILVQNTLLGVESALRSVAGALASRARAAPAHGRVLHVLDCMQRDTEGEGVVTSWGLPSARTLRRDMMAVVGLPLRTLAGILRFQRAMALLVTGTASIGEVAIAAGYADQSHMTREFRRFGGFTPAVPTPAPLVRLAP